MRDVRCNGASYIPAVLTGHAADCTTDALSCAPAMAPACFCTTYGTWDECYQQYYQQTFAGTIPSIDGDPGSGAFRGAQMSYWHGFEFVLRFTVWNYALLPTQRDL